MKTAILQCSDSGPLDSLIVMLQACGYDCHLPDAALRNQLRNLGCDNVSSVEDTMVREGVERPLPLSLASPGMMQLSPLYVDIKAQRNAEKVWTRWPNLKTKTLWYRINGGQPTVVPGAGDEITPVCPILTPNLWYGTEGPWSDRAYACWPPFYRFDDYFPIHGRAAGEYTDPICLVHNLTGWGYGHHADGMQKLGVKIHGRGSPDGLIQHSTIPKRLASALAMVHLKNNDAPGYALYEALAAACPLVVSQRLIYKNLMQDLFVDGETCLVYDHCEEALVHHPHTEEEIRTNIRQVRDHLDWLRDPEENVRIGLAGRQRLRELQWCEDRDGDGLRAWMMRQFG